MSVGTQARDSGTHISHVRRVIIDYYIQGHWIKLLSFLRDKLRGAGRFPVGLSETFYAAFSKNGCAPAAAASRFRNSDSIQTLSNTEMWENTVGRDAKRCMGKIFRLRHSACNRCSGETSRRVVSRGLHREPWDFRLQNYFHMRQALESGRRASAQTPSTDF